MISGRAISGDLGPRRVTSGDLAQSRAIPELHATPLHPTPPHPPPRRAISGDLGASLARRHTCSKKEGPGWSHGAHEDVLARFSPPRPAPLGPVRRRPARRVPRPVTPTPARTAHLQPSRGYSCAHAGEPGGTPFPPPPTGQVGSAPLGACACHACPPARADAKAKSTTCPADARAKPTARLVPRLNESPLRLFPPPTQTGLIRTTHDALSPTIRQTLLDRHGTL